MNLSILERIMTIRVLPNLETLTNLYLCLSLTDEEVEELEIDTNLSISQMSWVGDKIVDIPIDERGTALIVEAFKKAHREKRLPPDAMSAYEKFVSE